ncbi:hypothetical protein DNTS_018249 [Danionella cerebrum]|uniref:Rab-GAP TBC domain-containing protein n=1 Tax=Danionella cerebrum TaxID=2873325 RepID=A0A553QL28_9TELE|nr:hypothetical protein DNTS_018249 [Danionella translucida]
MKKDIEVLIAEERAEIISKYNKQKLVEIERVQKWLKMLRNWNKYRNSDRMMKRVYKGIPLQLRGQAWALLLDVEKVKNENVGKYERMKKQAQLYSAEIKQIDLDINRTFRNHIMFMDRFGVKQQSLFHVLSAYSVYDSIAAMLLMFMNEEDAFWALTQLLTNQKHGMHGFYVPGFPKLQRFQNHHDQILSKLLPKIKKHLTPFTLTLRLWDIFILEGEKVLTAMAYTLLLLHKKCLLKMSLEELRELLQEKIGENIYLSDDLVIEQLKASMAELHKMKLDLPPPAKPEEFPRKPLGLELPGGLTLKRAKLNPSQDTPDKSLLIHHPPDSLHISLEQEDIVLDDSPPQDKKPYKDHDMGSMSPLPSPEPVVVHSQISLSLDGMIDGVEQPPPYEPPVLDSKNPLCVSNLTSHMDNSSSSVARSSEISLSTEQETFGTAEGSVVEEVVVLSDNYQSFLLKASELVDDGNENMERLPETPNSTPSEESTLPHKQFPTNNVSHPSIVTKMLLTVNTPRLSRALSLFKIGTQQEQCRRTIFLILDSLDDVAVMRMRFPLKKIRKQFKLLLLLVFLMFAIGFAYLHINQGKAIKLHFHYGKDIDISPDNDASPGIGTSPGIDTFLTLGTCRGSASLHGSAPPQTWYLSRVKHLNCHLGLYLKRHFSSLKNDYENQCRGKTSSGHFITQLALSIIATTLRLHSLSERQEQRNERTDPPLSFIDFLLHMLYFRNSVREVLKILTVCGSSSASGLGTDTWDPRSSTCYELKRPDSIPVSPAHGRSLGRGWSRCQSRCSYSACPLEKPVNFRQPCSFWFNSCRIAPPEKVTLSSPARSTTPPCLYVAMLIIPHTLSQLIPKILLHAFDFGHPNAVLSRLQTFLPREMPKASSEL